MNAPLIFTKDAAKKVFGLIKEEGNFNLKLRVYITGGGCSGFQYGFKFDEVINGDDTLVTQTIEDETEGESGGEITPTFSVQLVVDPISYPYLVGASIDYKEDIEGDRFIIRNPNAKTTCGCGSSFSA